MQHSKRMSAIRAKVEQGRHYTLEEAVEGVKTCATAKFNETVELAFLLGVDPRHADQMVRGIVSLPHGTGKEVRVVVFCNQEDQKQASLDAGAVAAGGEELVQKVQGGWTEFDAAVATPDMMRFVGRLGKVLGPRGLMPSPKAGTVTADVGHAVNEIKKGKIDFRVDKNANIHVPVGKASFSASQIMENASAVIDSVLRARPSACKGIYLKSCAISSTMGPGFRLDPAALAASFRPAKG
ncbi:MAG TPA: 50S ribosomal protein L1 [Candidatus Hydrogenedentes bacterium]|nr:50S ribosomal protein L1 [Candidatus Hydrogenedentota bacterium]HPG70074.1 50S ribosomal protein L1 [Candidatus Hydrogenedentota bacterium]